MLATNRPVVIDGGLATELEAQGHDLTDGLWSARLLRDEPSAIEQTHAAYMRAGARVAISASYQASVESFANAGVSEANAEELLARSVELAQHARVRVALEEPDVAETLVAASIGPYGAILREGQEYSGDYGDVDAPSSRRSTSVDCASCSRPGPTASRARRSLAPTRPRSSPTCSTGCRHRPRGSRSPAATASRPTTASRSSWPSPRPRPASPSSRSA